MDTQAEKVYVALGNDIQDGFKTLDWTLKKWNSQQISIVILHVTYNISNDFVYTPFGKLPSSSVSDEKLAVLNKYEQEKIDTLLSKYKSFCGQVKAELLRVEKCEEPSHKAIIDLIFEHKITKLVMGFAFLKTSSWRIKSAVSGSFYVHQNKPDFCKLYVICGGRLVFLKEANNEGIMEDAQGVMVSRLRESSSFKGWIGKMFNENSAKSLDRSSRRSLSFSSLNPTSPNSHNQWENYAQEIENYFQHLVSLKLEEENFEQEAEDNVESSAMELANPELADSNTIAAEDIESRKKKLKEAQETIKLKRKEAKANVERRTKAEGAISVCNRRAEELEARIQEEVTKRAELKKELDSEKEQLHEVIMDAEESKSRLNSLVELQFELSNKLQSSTLAKSNSEAQLEKAASTRAEMVREIEELRKQRDVLHRRIEFCKERDAIGIVSKLTDMTCAFKEYTAEEIRLATSNFSERLRIKPGGDWTTMYRGRINRATVAIKMLDSADRLSEQEFQAKVSILGHIRHPHLVCMIGFCTELRCIVFEYMHNGSLRDIFLRDILFSSHKGSKTRKRTLGWHDRIRIAAEICSALAFLQMAKPKPIVHGRLSLSNILLDRNLVTKISGFGLSVNHGDQSVRSDIRAFGVLMMHLLTGRNWAGLGQAMNMDRAALVRDLDEMAGQWPLDLAEKLAGLALRCLTSNRGPSRDLRLETVMEELNELREKADDLMARGTSGRFLNGGVKENDPSDVPSFFLCPIFKEVMKNPHAAADGFSYELEAIEEWLKLGHDTSPMTNLRLKHTILTPNHTLRSLIQDWHNKRHLPPP